MDTFNAVPVFRRETITHIDYDKFDVKDEKWITSNKPIPTITKTYIVWEKGPGCPVPVVFETDRITTEYIKNYPKGDITQIVDTDELNEYVDNVRRVNALLRRNLLCAVVDNLDERVANVLANEDGPGRQILARAGWMDDVAPLLSENDNEDVENKTEGNDETGESNLSISTLSTQESTS